MAVSYTHLDVYKRQVLGKKYDGKTAAMAAAILLLLQQPEYLHDASFLLSFTAVAAVSYTHLDVYKRQV